MATIKNVIKATPKKVIKPAIKKTVNTKKTAPKVISKKPVEKKDAEKVIRKQIQGKLESVLLEYKTTIGDEKFHELIKKASKLFSSKLEKENKHKEKTAKK